MRLKSMSGAGGPMHGRKRRRLARRDGRGIEVETVRPQGGARVNALRSARGTAAAPPRVQKCSCDGGGWIVTLDRDRYQAPGTAGDGAVHALYLPRLCTGPARSGGAGAV